MTNPQSEICNPKSGSAWHITDWRKYYEVDKSGRRWDASSGSELRPGPLRFVQLLIGGPQRNKAAYLDVAATVSEAFGADRWAPAFGLFCQLLEFAGDRTRATRGFILGRGRGPMSLTLMSTLTGFTKQQITEGLEVLSDPGVGWIEQREIPGNTGEYREIPKEQRDTAGDSGEQQETAGDRGEQRSLQNETETEQNSTDKPEFEKNKNSSNGARALYDRFVQLLPIHLHWSRDGIASKQATADRTCFRIVAEFVALGDLGDPTEASQAVRVYACKCAATAKNPMAQFTTWFEKELAKHGHDWSERTGDYAFEMDAEAEKT